MNVTQRTPFIQRRQLDKLYRRSHTRAFVHPDPAEFLDEYPDLRDREIVGFIGSSLAYGRLAQIERSVSRVLGRRASHSDFLKRSSMGSLRRARGE